MWVTLAEMCQRCPGKASVMWAQNHNHVLTNNNAWPVPLAPGPPEDLDGGEARAPRETRALALARQRAGGEWLV